MDRLSDKATKIVEELRRASADSEINILPLIKALERLGEYENTGRTPREANEMVFDDILGMKLGVPIERLHELAEAEKGGKIWILPTGMTAETINYIMGLCERVRAMRVSKGEEDMPVITWQLYNALAAQSRAEAEKALEV